MSVEDAVKVCLRVRPLILREQGDQVNLIWTAEHNTISQFDGSRSFNFDRVFHSHETTAQVYQEVAVPIIRSALHGYNGTIFAYGQTSSGKTYTMMGAPNNLGIIPQAVGEVFKIIQEIPNREFLLRVSYMEIYNESVTDLLCDNRKKKPLEVREDFNHTVYVADLTEEVVTIPEQVMQWIKKGEKHRHYGETKMNDHSSRSHTIFRMIVESRERNDPGNSENCDGAIMVSHLNLVDLAGSERASQTGAEGVRLKEGCNINRSLFILGQVIKKLSDGQVGGFINYRDSKLTRILQNSLGGNTKTVIICTITPISLDETLSTLQFASTAKHVKNTPHVNEVLDDHALLKRYRKEILDLKKQLEGLEASTNIKTHAMAMEEYNQLLSEIKELQKEKEDRICNLGNMMVASTQQSHEDQRFKKRRRVTWAPGKLQDSLHSAGISHFDIASKVTAHVAKRPKLSEFSTIPEIDESTCTEFSEFDDTGRVLDDLAMDADWNSGNNVAYRERTALSYSMMDFSAESTSAVIKDHSMQQKCKTEQKVAVLENQLKKLTEEYEVEAGKRESLEKEVAELKQAKSHADKDVQTPELEDTSVKDQTDAQPEDGQQSPVTGGHVEVQEKLSLKTADFQEQETLQDSPLLTQIDALYQGPDKEAPSSSVHDMCWEHIRMLEQKIADLEGSACPENNSQNDLIESLQICEALMAEKQCAHEQLGSMQHDFDHLIAENESLKRELADMENRLEEKNETTEFEMLEKAAQKEHEAQLMYENSNLKALIDNSEVYNKELENEVESKSKLLLEQEQQITELKRESEILQKKVRYSDLMASMGSGEKLCEEVFQMQKSLTDAETVTRDAQREAAFLRSENLELKERMEELLVRCEKGEKDASDYEKKLEFEKSKYKMMLSDLQKELQHAFNEVNHLNGLMAGKVPKELLSRIELEKKVEDYSKQMANILEEKNELEQKIASFSESLHLCSEVENLRDQAQRTSEELVLLKSGTEQSASIINDQEHKLEEQSEQLEKLTGEVTQLQVKYQQAEQQYSELKMQHERCSLTVVDQNKNDSEAQCLLMEVECAERQGMETRLKELDELYKSSCMENHKLQGQVDHLLSEVTSLQHLSEKQSELCKEKQDLEEKYNVLLSVKEQLQEQLHVYSLSVLQPENAEPSSKLQELQDELNVIIQHRDELLVKMEDLEAEKNNLKQDLSDNIELSIETQEELRTTQEELEQQKKLVADLRQQLADTGDSPPQAEDQKDILAEKLSAMTEKLHENETKCESLTNEKLELERKHQNLVSEMKLLQERMHSAELALSKVEEENAELKQNFKELLKSCELDEMPNIGNLASDPSKQVKQEEEGEGLQLQGQISAMLQEKDELHQTMKDLTTERDQLKLDLQENIEMSIDIQEELRSALDELKVKTQLLDSLSAQMNEIKVGENRESNRSALQGEMEEKSKIIEALETKVEDVLRNLQDAELKYENMVETLELITKEKDNLISSLTVVNNNLVNDLAMCKQDKSTQDCGLQVSIEMPTNDQVDTATRQEEIETERNELKETLSQLQQQLNLISQEKEELQQSIDTFKAERCELLTNLQRYAENSTRTQEELQRCQEELHQHITLVTNLRMEASCSTPKVEKETITDLTPSLEENTEDGNLQDMEAQFAFLSNEKSKIEEKLLHLQQHMEMMTNESNELRVTIQSLQSERDQLKEDLGENVQMSIETRDDLRKAQDDLQQQIQMVEELTCKTTSLEQKLASVENQLRETVLLLKEANSERELIELSKEKLLLEREDLHNEIETKKLALDKCEKEGSEAGQKISDLTAQLKAASEERNKMELRNEELQKLSTEIQDDLLKAQEELQQQKHRVEKLTNDISLLEEKNTEDGNLQDMEAQFASLSNEKSKIEEKLLHLQQHMEMMTNESNELRVTIQSLQSERDQLKEDLGENVQMSIETRDDLRKAQDDLQQQIQMVEELTCKTTSLEQKLASVENQLRETVLLLKEANSERELIELSKEKLLLEREDLHNEIETKKLALDKCEKEGSEAGQKISDLTAQLKAASEERNKMELRNEELQKLSTEIQDDLQKAQEELQQQKHRVEKLTNEISLLEEKNTEDGNLQDMEAQFASLSNEKSKIEEKLLHLQQHMEMMTNESNELRVTIQSLQSERDQLKEDLGENVQMSIETQDDLRKAQDDLQQQIQMVEELTCKTTSLEQKLASVENQLQETVLLLKEANSERELIELSKEKLLLEREDLHNEIETKKLALDKCEKEGSEAGQKISDLTAQLKAASEERNKMELRNEELQKLSTEIQDDLLKAQEELQQQKHRVEKLTNDISLLEEKSSSLERELEEKNYILDKAAEDRCVFDMSKQNLTTELEQAAEALKSKDFELKEAEKEKAATSQILLELTKEIKSVAQERDDLQNSRQKLEEEAEKLREEIQQLRHERNLLTAEQVRKTNQLNELETELQQLQEKMRLSEASTEQMKTDNIALREQLQQCELNVASLHQEHEQFQQLLQRARSEKENIYSTLQDQEKAVAEVQDELITSQKKLQTVIKERDESREHLLEKVNEVKERLQEISSLQEQMQQLHEEVKAEKRKNFDLLEDVDLLEKEVRALRLMQNEPVQEVDELAGCTEILEEKNKEWKDLMVKIYTVYSDHHSSLNNVSWELQTMTQAQNQSMSTVKESLSSTFSRTFGNLQTEHVKLNSQMQMLLNKFKVLYKSAAVKEEHYSSAEDFENELCVLQKKNDQLLLQCQSLEQCGSKWSETVAEELKFCEIEFMNQMISKKVDVLKNVEGGFSEVQVVLNSIENELKQEKKCKEEFIEWLSEFQSLHFDAKKLNDGVLQENRRIAGVIQNLTKKLKIIAQSKTKHDTMLYLNSLKAELHEKKEKNMDLLQRMQKIAPSGDSSMLEEENARLCETLKNVQGELKKMQCRIQDLEKQLSAVESDAKQKEQRALLLEDKLRSKVAVSELSEMQVTVKEKEKLLQAAQKEIQILQEKISKGAAPYKEEIENLKSRVVWVEMERVKFSKSTEQQISSLKASVEDKETRLRKLKEELRRTQKDTDTSICSTSSTSPQYPLTCGGGSGIVQSTAMLMLQSQNAALKREIGQYKKKVHQLSRTISSCEDEVKKRKEPSPETPTPLLSSLHSDEVMCHSNTDPYRTTLMSPPRKSEMPSGHIASQAKTAIHGDNQHLLSKIDVHKLQPMSPNKMERHSAPVMSPDKTRLYGKRPFSPLKTDGPLLSTLTESPPKKHTMPEKVDSPKEKFFDVRSKSLPYCPSKFFDNSALGTFPGLCMPPSESNTSEESDIDFSAGTTADSAINDWWDRTGKNEKPNDCKTS
ncbi:centromere-associated protein E isoform X2 [Ranitomeya imitator]|uniref:centromere-associated protein E isoform X2 n=1 Tax=Ranitomeya imitator TaxID=111125 RepID=UPI0037E85FE7